MKHTFSVRGFCYERVGAAEDDVASLVVPFSSITFHIKDSLRELGFRCLMDQRQWELQGGKYTPSKEQQLRYLLQHSQLPDADMLLPPLPIAVGLAPPPAAAAAAAAATTSAAMSPAAVTPAAAAERRQLRRPRPTDFDDGVQSFLGGRVTMQREDDGHVLLTGAPLRHIRPQLERILHFEPTATEGAAHYQGWRSTWALSDAEASFVAALLQERQQRLRDGSHDDLAPIPTDLVLPARFRPRDADGTQLRGPYISRNGKPWNIGRQFFSTFQDGVEGGFIWADGTEAFGREAVERCMATMGPSLMDMLSGGGGGPYDDWEEDDYEEWEGDEEDDDDEALSQGSEDEGSEEEEESEEE